MLLIFSECHCSDFDSRACVRACVSVCEEGGGGTVCPSSAGRPYRRQQLQTDETTDGLWQDGGGGQVILTSER